MAAAKQRQRHIGDMRPTSSPCRPLPALILLVALVSGLQHSTAAESEPNTPPMLPGAPPWSDSDDLAPPRSSSPPPPLSDASTQPSKLTLGQLSSAAASDSNSQQATSTSKATNPTDIPTAKLTLEQMASGSTSATSNSQQGSTNSEEPDATAQPTKLTLGQMASRAASTGTTYQSSSDGSRGSSGTSTGSSTGSSGTSRYGSSSTTTTGLPDSTSSSRYSSTTTTTTGLSDSTGSGGSSSNSSTAADPTDPDSQAPSSTSSSSASISSQRRRPSLLTRMRTIELANKNLAPPAKGWEQAEAKAAPNPYNLPPRFCRPKADRPLVWFTQRSTIGGGYHLQPNWVEEAVFSAAQQQNYSTGVRCQGGTSCYPQDDRREWKYEVMSGQYTWQHIFSNLPNSLPRPPITCVTVFGFPMERIRMCLSKVWSAALEFSELTGPQMRKVLSQVRSIDGYGCVNEPIRLFSGFGTEMEINAMWEDPEFSKVMVARAKKNLENCVVLMKEDIFHPRTASILRYWAPGLRINFHPSMDTDQQESPMERLNGEQVRAIRDVAGPEFELFDWAQQRYMHQLEHMRRTAASACIP